MSDFILLVDDNPTNLAVLKKSLKITGFKTRLESSGERAIAIAQAEPPSLILLDIQMPGIDGFETCCRLKADPTTAQVPIIFMTALSDTESKVKGLSLGAVDYITKPFEQEEVIARVQTHLRMQELTQQLQQMNATLEQRVIERTAMLQKMQIQAVQQEKLATLGQLMAGVAHEMNNPLNCIASNLTPLKEYAESLEQFWQRLTLSPPLQEMAEDLDLDFIMSDMPKLIGSMQVSSDRIKEISTSIRVFARTDSTTTILTNLHEGIDGSLLILHHRLKAVGARPEIRMILDYGDLPLIPCYPGPINQVFMNLLSNAIDAVEQVAAPMISITTTATEDSIKISISDNGFGMGETVREHLFEPFFTTKNAEHGTGLGLPISRQIVEEKHGGQLLCHSVEGEGTEFTITLPLRESSHAC